ncbi:hypothetical protein [Natranaerovirga hydrolytica]|uniref:hypothetical protein n=1 Tax=Natranaerovirga hydrolytica TaxID=680378 RepID=UPI00104FD035|nr:hypothetical protein [Natranaerovirga hydrolytica]
MENNEVKDSDILEEDMVNEADTIENDIDYSSFIKKIWINESSEQQDNIDDLFLYLNKVESDNVEGEIFIGKMPISSYYYYNPPFSEKYPWNLIGTVKGDSVECELFGEEMNGNISLALNNAYIEGNVELTEEVVLNDKFIDEDRYKFRPYTINDVTLKYNEMGISTTLLDEHSYGVHIDTWGKVYFKSMMINSNKSHPAFFLTNEENEILYQLNAPFQNGLDVTEISIDDIDRDGLEDIVVILGDKDTSIGGVVAWIFFQTEDGFFCVRNEVQKDLNIKYYDTINLKTKTLKEYFEFK